MIKRKIFKQLVGQGKDKKISLIFGPRQSGKTTILKELYNEFCVKQKYNGLFLDIDILSSAEKIKTYEDAISTFRLSGYDENQKSLFYVFLDEIQKYSNSTKILKNIYDSNQNIKIYATGSSALQIKDLAQESLAGRKIINYLYTLDFFEYLWFKDDKTAISQYENIANVYSKDMALAARELYSRMEEFIIYGGYPEVALTNEPAKKKELLAGIFELFLKKDVLDYISQNKLFSAKKVLEYLALNNGRKIKYEEITALSQMNFKELKSFIEVLSEIFLIKEVRPYFTNKNNELVKVPKFYFLDNGARNFFINNFNQCSIRNDCGFLFEGFIFSEIIKNSDFSVLYWEDKNNFEVDFVINKVSCLIPIEVKYKKTLSRSDFRGIIKYMSIYKNTKTGIIVNLNEETKESGIHKILPFGIGEKINDC
ncbi:MAG: ATP-binding protein [archaeon]